MLIHVDPAQVLAFRMEKHHLAQRLPPGLLVKAASPCGIQNTTPGSAGLAFYARVTGLQRALFLDRTLVQLVSLRASATVVCTTDISIFTRGLLPEDDVHFID